MSTNAIYRLSIGAVAVVMSGGLIAQSAHADTLDIDYLTSQGGNNTISNAANAQSFSPTISGQLTSVGLVLRRVLPSTPSGTRLTIAVEGADSKVPNGVRLATASVLDSLIPDGKGEVTVNFTTPTSVEAGNRYTLVLEAPAGTNYQWYFSNTLYAEEAWAYKPSGSNWGSANTDFTQAFGVYITATQPSPVADAQTSTPGAVQITLDAPAGADCIPGSVSGVAGTWVALPTTSQCRAPNIPAEAKLLGWATEADFPIDIAQRQVDNGWGAYEIFNDDGQLTGVFVPAGGYTLFSNDTNLYPIYSR